MKVIHQLGQRAPYCVPLVAAAIVHGCKPFESYFRLEDLEYFFVITNGGFWQFLRTYTREHMNVVQNVVFYALFKMFHLHSVPWYLFVLGLHLVNVKLLYDLILRFTLQRRAAVIFATLWGISPVGQGALVPLTGIGHVMVASLLLWLLLDITRIKQKGERIGGRVVIRWCLLLLGMAGSFGGGIGIAMVFGFVAWLLLRGVSNRTPVTVALLSLSVTVPLTYLVHAALQWTRGVDLQSPPIAFSNAGFWLSTGRMFSGLVGYSLASLLLGPLVFLGFPRYAFPISDAGCLVVGFLLILSVMMRRVSKEMRRQIMALALLIAAVCGMIALGRGWMFAGFQKRAPSGELMASARFYYAAPMLFAIWLAMIYAAACKFSAPRSRAADGLALTVLAVMLIPSLQAARAVYPGSGMEEAGLVCAMSHGIRSAVVKAGVRSVVYVRNSNRYHNPGAPEGEYPGMAVIFVIVFPDNEVLGKRVCFVEENAAVVEWARKRKWLRTSKLLVTPQEARGQPVEEIPWASLCMMHINGECANDQIMRPRRK
jgi:hypothetical protein